MEDEQRDKLQREMGQAFYADVCRLEDENKALHCALEAVENLAIDYTAKLGQLPALGPILDIIGQARVQHGATNAPQRAVEEQLRSELGALTLRFDETADELHVVRCQLEGTRAGYEEQLRRAREELAGRVAEHGACLRWLNEIADAIGWHGARHFSELPAAVRAAVQRREP